MATMSEQLREIAVRVCDSLAAIEAADVAVAGSLPAVMDRLDDDGLQALLVGAAAARAEFDAVIAAGAGVIAKRSDREMGYNGLAARRGHRSGGKFLQSITGSTQREAFRQMRLGEAMAEADAARRLAEATPIADVPVDTLSVPEPVEGLEPSATPPLPWCDPVTQALSHHVLSAEGAAAIIHAMGDPNGHCDTETLRAAALDLLAGVARTVAEDPAHAPVNTDVLTRLARQTRDRIDPEGVTERFQRRYEERTCRLGRTEAGARTAFLQFDEESAAWIDTVVDAYLRPRRGGPRFVDAVEAAQAEKLRNDPRSNDQVVFDLLMDTLRAGVLADPATVFATRQAGVRVIVTQDQLDHKDHDGNLVGTGFLEETGDAVSVTMIEHLICESGTTVITVDGDGNPLNVGREHRLFTTKQKLALAYRDGGCMDPDCDGQGPSKTEAHHIDEWDADTGKTDIADGISLCPASHLRIHNQHWKIRREGTTYWMIPPKDIDPNQTPRRMRTNAASRHHNTG